MQAGGLGSPRPSRVLPVGCRDGLVRLEVPEAGGTACRALTLLREKRLAPLSVVRVDPWGIAFLNRCGKVRTCWVEVEAMPGGEVRRRFTVESGLPAFPTEARCSA